MGDEDEERRKEENGYDGGFYRSTSRLNLPPCGICFKAAKLAASTMTFGVGSMLSPQRDPIQFLQSCSSTVETSSGRPGLGRGVDCGGPGDGGAVEPVCGAMYLEYISHEESISGMVLTFT